MSAKEDLDYLRRYSLQLVVKRIPCYLHICPPLTTHAMLLLCLQILTTAEQSILLAPLDAPSQNQTLSSLALCLLPALQRLPVKEKGRIVATIWKASPLAYD